MFSTRKEATLADFGDILDPHEAMEPILAAPVRAALLEWLTEIWAAEELRAVGLTPRARALFHGPPGVGKTTLAHHLAARLGLPLAAIRPDRLVDCWLGSTGRNIGALFDAAAAFGPCVLFFDEFDAIAGRRQEVRQSADSERNASLDVLLQRIEAHDGYMIAATNLHKGLDPAIWRRFDIQIALELPGRFERERILSRYLAPYGLPARALRELAEATGGATPALMRQFCEGLKRQIVLGPRVGWDMGRAATIGRILAAVGPHPDLGKPRLWSHGADDAAVRLTPWPLPLAASLTAEADAAPEAAAGSVVPFGRGAP